MTTDEDFRHMANAAYDVYPLWTDHPIESTPGDVTVTYTDGTSEVLK